MFTRVNSLIPNRYAVLGHSDITIANKDAIVPRGVNLVFLSECGYVYSKNDEHRPILRNTQKTTNFLNSGKGLIYGPGSIYRDQYITMPLKNKVNLLHGIYKLPVNLSRPRPAPIARTVPEPSPAEKKKKKKKKIVIEYDYPTRPVNTRNNLSRGREDIRLSEVLEMVSDMGGGTVIAVICRPVGNLTLSNAREKSTRKVAEKRLQAHEVYVKGKPLRFLGRLGGIETFKTLRPLKSRVKYRRAINNSESIRASVPRPPARTKPGLFASLFGKPVRL